MMKNKSDSRGRQEVIMNVKLRRYPSEVQQSLKSVFVPYLYQDII